MPYQDWMTPTDQESQFIPWLMKKLAGGGDPNFYKQQVAPQVAPTAPQAATVAPMATPAMRRDAEAVDAVALPPLSQAMNVPPLPADRLPYEGPDAPFDLNAPPIAQAMGQQPGILQQIMGNPYATQLLTQMGAGLLKGKDLKEGLANAFDASSKANAVKRTPLTGAAAGLIMEEYPDGRKDFVSAGDLINKARGKPSPGYQWKADGSGQEPIPGGPKDPNSADNARIAGATLAKLNSRYQIANQTIDKALSQVDWSSSGFIGQLSSIIGGSPAANLESTLDTLASVIGFKELEEMRASSKTGGALGQVAVRELEMLQASLGSLKQKQGPGQLRDNLKLVRDRYNSATKAIADLYRAEGREIPEGLKELVGDNSPSTNQTTVGGSVADRASGYLR